MAPREEPGCWPPYFKCTNRTWAWPGHLGSSWTPQPTKCCPSHLPCGLPQLSPHWATSDLGRFPSPCEWLQRRGPPGAVGVWVLRGC